MLERAHCLFLFFFNHQSRDLETQRSDLLNGSSNPLLLRHAQNALTRMNEGMPLFPSDTSVMLDVLVRSHVRTAMAESWMPSQICLQLEGCGSLETIFPEL
jgi:hypothetical protein